LKFNPSIKCYPVFGSEKYVIVQHTAPGGQPHVYVFDSHTGSLLATFPAPSSYPAARVIGKMLFIHYDDQKSHPCVIDLEKLVQVHCLPICGVVLGVIDETTLVVKVKQDIIL
jgi:hypothetical protein